MSTTVYRNATIFTADPESSPRIVDAFAVADGHFCAVGSLDEVRAAVGTAAHEIDLHGAFVAPGIIDSHSHLTMFGKSLAKVPLRDCKSLARIQERLTQARQKDPHAPRVLGVGWLFDAVGDSQPTAAMLDEVLPDVPVYLEANDLHSMWVNSAALREMGITDETPDPIGGKVSRDSQGHASGMLYETASIEYAWAFLDSVYSDADIVHALELAFDAYLSAGVTGATEMSLDATELKALRTLIRRNGCLPFPITAHWLMMPSSNGEENRARVTEVATLRDEIAASDAAPWLRISGVKFIMDGVIDACTATMRHPYANGSNADPIWSSDLILPAAVAADRAGLAIAMHAIGDRTSEIALDVVSHCITQNGKRARRHRIEHLESVADTTIERLAELEVVASMQPVHCDPAVLDNWKAMLGDERSELGFPWQKFRAAGVKMTLGTDAPTAPHQPLPNLYIALTGASVLAPELPAYHPERAFTPTQALVALTAGAAYAGGIEDTTGRIRVGHDATFIVLDVNPLDADPKRLLDARVLSTTVRGRELYQLQKTQ